MTLSGGFFPAKKKCSVRVVQGGVVAEVKILEDDEMLPRKQNSCQMERKREQVDVLFQENILEDVWFWKSKQNKLVQIPLEDAIENRFCFHNDKTV